MCRPDLKSSKEAAKVDAPPTEEKTHKGTTVKPVPKLSFSDFFDLNKPWVLVPDGSFGGYFDNVPLSFRVGPWNIACCAYLFALVYWMLWECVQCYNNPPPPSNYNYFGSNTWQWYYNLAGFSWAFFIAYRVAKAPAGLGAWCTYTLQSWTMITIRHGLSVLTPFFPSLSPYAEYLRFPMLLQTGIVFLIWNFALMPAVTMTLKDSDAKWGFLKFCFGFDLANLHIVNLPLAVLSGLYGSPARELDQVDFCVALALALQYVLFYLFFLDRLGVHLYFIFSPRSPLALVSWSTFIGCIYAGFRFWKDSILEHGTVE